jgi:hypothetical protein
MSNDGRRLTPPTGANRFAGWFLDRPFIFFALASLAGMSAYLLYASAAGVRFGFPLDDAWIHQTYARNLAQYGDFAYVPGAPSAGSTSPLWTLLLSAGYFAGLPYRVWTFTLGWLTLAGAGWGVWRLSRRLWPGRPAVALAAGALCCIEWRLIWAALSGMETLLFCTLALLLLARAIDHPDAPRAHAASGLLGGLLILTRPEGALLAALVGLNPWIGLLQRRRLIADWPAEIRAHLVRSLALSAGVLLPVAPYVAFNLIVSGSPFPNTFYAKQAEYHILVESLSLPARWVRVIGPTLVGGPLLLVPGLLAGLYASARAALRRWRGVGRAVPTSALPALYWFVFTIPYAASLPVTYQHGRYLMPSIPLLILLGAGGAAALLELLRDEVRRRLATVATLVSVALLAVAFVGLGARGYVDDVTVINGEMVAVAEWLNEQTPEGALIAAHDIGAIGYFARRPLLDLAGLVTPEVIPIIRDEPALLEFVLAEGADFLVTFPSWYPEMVASPALEMLYQTDCARTRALGEDNMAVYRTHR